MKNKDKKFISQEIRLLGLMTIFFAVCIFFVNNYVLVEKQRVTAEEHMEQSMIAHTSIPVETQDYNILQEKIKDYFNSASKVHFEYIPDTFQGEVISYTELFNDYLEASSIKNKVLDLGVEFYKDLFDVRGKMKDKTVKLFGVLQMNKSEFLAVAIHESAHYIDIYFLDKKVFEDLSTFFYNISWESTKTLKAGGKQEDFVSGYAMTNKYEDFAETFTYYVIHNRDFLEKTKNSKVLKQKYDFFSTYIFRDNSFGKQDFSPDVKTQNYYRDITKIDFDLDNFLQFLKSGI